MPCILVGALCVSDLEGVIEEIRRDVVGRRCRVSITEVERLALALSQLSRSLASLKGASSYTFYNYDLQIGL